MNAEFPAAFEFLFEPHRYKILYGGRGGAKSWNIARWLLIDGARRPLRVLCARETQKSIADSVHKLLSDQIEALGLSDFYAIERARIIGANGTEFVFAGLKHDPGALKSYEAVDVAWVEEAQTVSDKSWSILIPTIRKESSEIVVSFNPDLEADPTFQRFVVNPPPGAVVKKVNWSDNPWFPAVLRAEMEHDRATDPDKFSHVWEGNCINILAGAIYAAEMRAADSEGRITRVPYDRTRPVDCYWDLGYGDLTAIWFAQSFPFEYRLIDYIEDSAKPLHWYLEQMQQRGYVYGYDYLPWDIGKHARLMGGGKSIEELMRLAGRRVKITTDLSVAEGINAARTVFPLCYFDRERCADGLMALRHYRYGQIKTLDHPSREPLHDFASHGSDAFRYFAVSARPPKQTAPPKKTSYQPVTAWS